MRTRRREQLPLALMFVNQTSGCFHVDVSAKLLPGGTCKVFMKISDSRAGFHNQIRCDMSHVSVGGCVRDEKCLCRNTKKTAILFSGVIVSFTFLSAVL